jgi:hypothetical protein
VVVLRHLLQTRGWAAHGLDHRELDTNWTNAEIDLDADPVPDLILSNKTAQNLYGCFKKTSFKYKFNIMLYVIKFMFFLVKFQVIIQWFINILSYFLS